MSEPNPINQMLKRMFIATYNDNNLHDMQHIISSELSIPSDTLSEILNPDCIDHPTEAQVLALQKIVKTAVVTEVIESVTLKLDEVDVQSDLLASIPDTSQMQVGWNQSLAQTIKGIVTNCRTLMSH